MKTRTLLVFFFMLASLFAERDFRPVWRMENIPAADASIQQCYIFRTIPGVLYRVESSHDLSDWTDGDEFYGMGHEYAVPMREFTPPPQGGGQLPSGNVTPARVIGLRMLPSSGTAGGVVVSWCSLDNNAPVNMLLAQTMAAQWNTMPLFFSERFGAYYFSIFCGSLNSIPPPAENPALGPKDSAMYAQLETSFPLMNQAVIESTARALNRPPPAPPDPNSRKFWRVFCDWRLDTDEDGSPDWMEFEMAAQTTGGPTPPLRGDAFSDDTNHNGIRDGEELDYDKDGVADAKDAVRGDASATFPIGPAPRYALFPITNAEPAAEWPFPIQINDKGTVLYTNGTWKAGKWTPLTLNVSGSIENASARGINDSDKILGIGYDNAASSFTDYYLGRLTCYWPTPADPPLIVEKSDSGLVRSHFLDTPAQGSATSPFSLDSGPILANDGGFYSEAYRLKEDKSGWIYLHHSRWKLPSGGQPATHSQARRGMRYSSDSSGHALWWGFDEAPVNPKGLIIWGSHSRPCDFLPTNVSVLPKSRVLAMSKHPEVPAQVLYSDGWHKDTIYSPAIDISVDGLAIGKAPEGKSSPILINGKWTEIKDFAPRITGEWETGAVLLDTTPGGWVLAKHQPASGDAQYGALLPIRLNGVDPDYTPPTVEEGQPVPEPPDFFAGGVDHLTARAEGGDGYVPELWIMAPIAGSTSVRWKSPLNSANKLKPVCDKAVFNPEEITESAGNVAVTGNALEGGESATVTDFPAILKLGTPGQNPPEQTALSTPVWVKRMKKRTVNVALHYVYSVDKDGVSALPFYQPIKADLELYLNKVYGPQVNVNFVVTPFTDGSATAGHDFDIDDDGKLETDLPDEVAAATPNVQLEAPGSNINIEVWMFGGGKTLKLETGGIHGEDLYGWASGNRKKILIDGNEVSYESIPYNGRMKFIHHVIAHEIGHVMTGVKKHPGEGGYEWLLRWTTGYDPYLKQRLMCPGKKASRNPDLLGCCLIKKEWDAIETWLKVNVDPPPTP